MKVVLVEWEDSSGYSGWHRFGSEDRIVSCVSVGILKYENKKQIVLLSSISNSGNILDTNAIPKSCIKRIRTLRTR